MAYAKLVEKLTEYQGESFTKILYKEENAVWADNEQGNYELFDEEGTVISSGLCQHVEADAGLAFYCPKSATTGLLGKHVLLVHLTDTVDTTFDDVIAEYKITYKERKA